LSIANLSRSVIFSLLVLSAQLAVVEKAEGAAADAARKSIELAERDFNEKWSQDAAAALRARGDAESRALALLLTPAFTRPLPAVASARPGDQPVPAASIIADGNDAAAIDEAAIEEAALTLEAEVGYVLDAIEQLPVEMRAVVVNELVANSDAKSRLALGARLAIAAPEDFAGWLMQLAALQSLEAEPAEVDALLLATAASMHGTSPWYLSLVRRMDAALAGVPAPAAQSPITWSDVLQPDAKAREGGIALDQRIPLDSLRLFRPLGLVMAVGIPGFQPMFQACEQAVGTGSARARARACTRIGRQLALHGATSIDASVGLAIWHRQVEGSPAEADVVTAKRRHHWQTEQTLALMVELWATPEGLLQYAALIRSSTRDELDLFRDLMRERGIPLTPPPQWLPANPAVLQARR